MADKGNEFYRSDLLREGKKRSCLTLIELTARLRVSINTLRNALAGKPTVKLENLKTLADYLEINWLDLFDTENLFPADHARITQAKVDKEK